MGFLKFAILATLGEVIGLRIKEGIYNKQGFGILPRAVVWGFLGISIVAAFEVFSKGTPLFLESLGIENASKSLGMEMCGKRILTAFSISCLMNLMFAPVMMTLHKITDLHILNNGGTLTGLFRPIPMGEIFSKQVNWNVQWNFVFKKTIPFFWIPAHTLTFLLPPEYRVLFAALLGIMLGILLSLASKK